jgi:putative Flp pilus-assembly TadE/G-like protein
MKRRGHYFKGQMAVVMTFAIATLLGAMALGTDVAVMYFNWVQLQKGADAAALAGAFYLVPANKTQYPIDSAAVAAAGCSNWSDDAMKAACTYAYKNQMAVDANNLKIVENSPNLPASAPTPNIQVWVNRPNLPYIFGKVIGLDTYSVSAKATGQDNYVGSYTGGIFPVLLQCPKAGGSGKCTGLGDVSSGFSAGTNVTFGAKFADVGASGNWQFLNIGGVGGANLGAQIAGGAAVTDLAIGGTVITKTGITWGDVNSGWNARMAAHNSMCASGQLPSQSCGSPPDANCSMSPIPANDPLLVTVPAGNLTGCTGSCSVTIQGFAQVYLYSMSKTTSSITLSGCFVQQTDPNGGSGGVANAPNLGAIAPPTLIQ